MQRIMKVATTPDQLVPNVGKGLLTQKQSPLRQEGMGANVQEDRMQGGSLLSFLLACFFACLLAWTREQITYLWSSNLLALHEMHL